MKKIWILVLLFTLFGNVSPALAAEPVAMITDAGGAVHLAGQNAALALLTYLPAGDEIVLDQGAHIVITYLDESAEYTFKGPARILIQQKSAIAKNGAAGKIRQLNSEEATGAGSFVRSGKLTFAAVEMRALPFKPSLLTPVNTKITTTTPLFSWKSSNEPINYHLTLSEENGNVIQDITLTDTQWQLPADAALKPDSNYLWSIQETLSSGMKSTASSRFMVADADTVAKIMAGRPAENASFSDKVIYAIFLESKGFKLDAKNLWRELSAQHPEDPHLKFRAQ